MKTIRALTLSVAFLSTSASATTNYQDWWWNPGLSGMGVNIGQQDNTVAAAWYLYGSDGKATFLILPGTIVNNKVTGNLYRSTGPLPGPSYNPNNVSETAVGTASITFTSANTATLAYDYDGLSGSIDLSRLTFDEPAISGTWEYSYKSTVSGCTFSGNNGTYTGGGYASISKSSGNLSITTYPNEGGYCVMTTSYDQKGSLGSGDGLFSCSGGISGSVSFSDVRVVDDFIILGYSRTMTSGETCRETGKLGGVRY